MVVVGVQGEAQLLDGLRSLARLDEARSVAKAQFGHPDHRVPVSELRDCAAQQVGRHRVVADSHTLVGCRQQAVEGVR